MALPLLPFSAIVIAFVLFGRLRVLTRPTTPSPGPSAEDRRVWIVVPARNEARSLPHLLADLDDGGLLSTDSKAVRVVVVDDHSTDDTRSIAAATPGVTVLDAPALPSGWGGKSWACHTGAEHAAATSGPDDLLVFVDADVRLAPGALDAVVAEHTPRGVVSVQPFHEVPTAVEQLSALFNVVGLMGIGAGTSRPTGMCGPVVCCSVADYGEVGGHRSVRAAVAEDVELAHRFLDADMTVRVLGGGELVRFRMYPSGWRAMVEGWSKNMATGATSVPLWRSIGVGWWVTGLLVAISGLTDVDTGDWTRTLPAVVVYGASAAALGVLLRRVGSFRWWAAAAAPLTVGFFVIVFLRSVWLTSVRRSVTWRGRTIDLRGSASP